jgi:hypothetical protein
MQRAVLQHEGEDRRFHKQKNGPAGQAEPFWKSEDWPGGLLLDLLQERKTRGNVFRDFVAGWERIQRAFLGLPCKKIEGDRLAAFENLIAGVQNVGLSGLFALDCVRHGGGFLGIDWTSESRRVPECF